MPFTSTQKDFNR